MTEMEAEGLVFYERWASVVSYGRLSCVMLDR